MTKSRIAVDSKYRQREYSSKADDLVADSEEKKFVFVSYSTSVLPQTSMLTDACIPRIQAARSEAHIQPRPYREILFQNR